MVAWHTLLLVMSRSWAELFFKSFQEPEYQEATAAHCLTYSESGVIKSCFSAEVEFKHGGFVVANIFMQLFHPELLTYK